MYKILEFDKSLTTVDQLVWQSETNSWMKDTDAPECRIVRNPHVSTDTFGTALGWECMKGFVNSLQRLNFPFHKETIFCAVLCVSKKHLNNEYNWRFKLKYFFRAPHKCPDFLRVASNYYFVMHGKISKSLQQSTAND